MSKPSFLEVMMACDCADCSGESNRFYLVKLIDGDYCVWCEDCLLSNNDLVEDAVLLKAPFDGRPRCPICRRVFEIVATSREYAIVGCPEHREYDRVYYFEGV
jgi:hypothetical protein